MEYIVEFLNQICAGIEAVFCVADYVLFCFAVMSATGLVVNYIYIKLLTNDRLTSEEDTASNGSLFGKEQTMELKEQVTTDTRTESTSKMPQSGGEQDVSRNSVVLLQLNNQTDELGILAECNNSEDLSLMNAQKPVDLLDIYTSMTDSIVPIAANTAMQLASNEEEDLYCSIDEINERHLSNSDSESGLRGDFTLHHQVQQDVTEVEIETAINLKNDNYHQLRKFVCQALIKGKHLPSWIMTEKASQVEAFLCKRNDAVTVAKSLLKEVIPRFRIPWKLPSNIGTQYWESNKSIVCISLQRSGDWACHQKPRQIYTCVVESVWTDCMMAWYGNTNAFERRILQMIPKKISQEGYGWINQWSLKHKHCGNSIEQLEICLETLQKEWAFIRSMQSETGRRNACRDLIEDQMTEQKIYEAIKFLMLYKAIHLHNDMENGRNVPEFCRHLFARSTSLYPYYLMINHLNLIGHSRDFEEIETELLKYTLESEINT